MQVTEYGLVGKLLYFPHVSSSSYGSSIGSIVARILAVYALQTCLVVG